VIFEPVKGNKLPKTKPLTRLELRIIKEELLLYCFPELDSIKETDASENSGILQIICESEIQKDDGELVCPIRILSQLFVVPNEFPRICKLVAPDVGESDEAAAMIGVKYERVVLAFNG